ncbi:transporter substrate-binding domain-containing protein [Brucella intermedia]|uniref:transporter substrate-binding domain-containing protein n=1 Tax=Brucella intermedia TaxID=94625 RepID=UPI00235E38E7|nr:transporter substrate-binding domain-containing protein [Brucella intermedia]
MLAAFIFLPFFLSAVNNSLAQQQATPSEPLIAGVYVSTPFVNKDGQSYSGMAIELWEKSAKALGRQYEYREYPSFEALIAAVENGAMSHRPFPV